jgi:hypothetical protein
MRAYEQAERLALLFLVDATGSMGPHIQAVKAQIAAIVADMRRTNPSMRLHLGFVGYRDHKGNDGRPDPARFDELPFTDNVASFQVPPEGAGGVVARRAKSASRCPWP